MTKEEAVEKLRIRCIGCNAKVGGDNDCDECEYRFAIEALKKQIPQKPAVKKILTNLPGEVYNAYDICPTCHAVLEDWNYRHGICKCGQKLDRGE